jgi:predicted extracellular nuclease
MPRALPAALAVIATLLAFAPGAAAQAPEVRINEFHYDNVGTDVGEAIELAGPAGTNLTGWQIVLYNGNGGAPYDTRTLTGPIPASGFVVAQYPSNGIQNGSPDGIVLVNAAGTVVDGLSYEGSFTAVGGPADGMVLEDIGVAEGSDTPVGHSLQLIDATWQGPFPNTFGAPNSAGGGGEEPPPGQPPVCDAGGATPIAEIQGSGDSSPLVGQQVETRGVVVGDFQAADELEGFFIHDPVGDGNPATSEGLFVLDPDAAALDEGDAVRVRGTVEESFGLTQLDDVDGLAICGEDGPLPAATELPVPSAPADRERLEGMLITVTGPLAATDAFNTNRFGEVLLASGGPLVNPTEAVEPGAAAQALAAENARRSLLLDDGSNARDPEPVPYLAPGDPVRRGDTVTGLTGVLSFGFGSYRVQPTEPLSFAEVNPRPAGPPQVPGDVRVASFNVLNYFTTLGERGADTPEEFDDQEAKIVDAINDLDAGVVALQEIENNGDVATQTLVDALNEDAGSEVWDLVPQPEVYGETDAIKVAMIYRPGVVQRVGPSLSLTGDAAFDNAREPLGQAFRAGDEVFSVVSNHFKSKGCGGSTGANADQGDGQGCFNADRVDQAQALAGFVDDLQERSGDPDVLVLGDLNSYGMEDPIDVLRADGLVDLLAGLPVSERYTFTFFGAHGRLDHGLATSELAERVAGADTWMTNADEAFA